MRMFERLLRDRDGLRADIEAGVDPAGTARALLIIIALAAGVLGGVIGAFRGGIQIPFAAIKLPLVVLVTAAVCTPALTVIRQAVAPHRAPGGPRGVQLLGRDIQLMLVSLAIGMVLAAAAAPVLLLFIALGTPYHDMTMAVTLTCVGGGFVGMRFIMRALRGSKRAFATTAATFVVVALVGAQVAWMGRPYLLRPTTPEPPFLRAVEGSLPEAVLGTFQTLSGVNDADWEPERGPRRSLELQSDASPDWERR